MDFDTFYSAAQWSLIALYLGVVIAAVVEHLRRAR